MTKRGRGESIKHSNNQTTVRWCGIPGKIETLEGSAAASPAVSALEESTQTLRRDLQLQVLRSEKLAEGVEHVAAQLEQVTLTISQPNPNPQTPNRRPSAQNANPKPQRQTPSPKSHSPQPSAQGATPPHLGRGAITT